MLQLQLLLQLTIDVHAFISEPRKEQGAAKKTDKTFLSDVAILLFKRLNGEKFGEMHILGVLSKKNQLKFNKYIL